MTGEDSVIYPEPDYGIEPEIKPESAQTHTHDFIFIPPLYCDQLPPIHNYEGHAVIDNYDPAIKEGIQNTTPDIIEDYDPRVDQEA